ncbi:hemicentin-2-like isoform X1 [Dreissena polymorpha]|uniref:hemicentin-2-like isoform X1 n=1 Tax=Dreissena polymorpha TaxID=45954 RepID=UPI0022651E84|nr:hemicentin-2-like isoform X1 [Dreissena polymorpha]
MLKMYLDKWMFFVFILTKANCNGCPTMDTAFGWIGSSPVFTYTVDLTIDKDKPVAYTLYTPTQHPLLVVSYYNGAVLRDPVYNNCALAQGGNISAGFLNIQLFPLQAGQQGTYTYTKTNVVQKCITLYIYGVPIQPTIGSNTKVAYEGSSAVLTCNSTSTTLPGGHNLIMTYEWRRDGAIVVTGGRFTLDLTTGRTLTISNINRNDALYSFSCSATEQSGNTSLLSSLFNLAVGYGPELLTLSPSNISYTLDENQRLNDITCSATCSPVQCTYEWRESGRGAVSSSGVLSLGNLERGEAGTYTCTASNPGSAATTSSQQIAILVRYGPEFVKLSPSNTSYTLDENQRLNDITCSATCSPVQCTYEWRKFGGGAVSSSGVLSLGTLERGEAGNYTCTASNPGSAATASSQPFGISVRYGPDDVKLSVPSEYIVTEGQVVSNVTCSSDCWPQCTYTWRNMTSGTNITYTGLLIMRQVDRYAAGSYVCVAHNPGSSHTKNNSTKLVVYYAPYITINVSSTNPTEGQPLDLMCEASGVPAMYRFTALTQTHGGVQILNTHITLDSSASTSTRIFRIPALRMDDTGTYKCSVENGVVDVSGQLYQTAETNLMVKVSPKVLTPSLKVAAATGANASLSIPVYAYPTLDKIVLQRYDGLNISSSSGKHILLPYNTNVTANWYGTKVQVDGTVLNFTIINLEPVDFGNYTLNMKNAFSVSSAVLTVVAESKPSSPAALNFTVIQKYVYFVWKRGFNGGHPQTFVIQLSKDSTDNYINHTTVIEEASIGPDDTVTFNITSLDVGVYHARLLTFNAIGAADPVMFGVFRIAKESDEAEFTSSASTGAIAGGIIGSLCGILIIALAVVAVMRYEIKCVRRQVLRKGNGDIRPNETTSPCEGNGTDFNNKAYETLDVDQGKAVYMSFSRQAVQCKTHVHLKSEDNSEKAVYMNTSFETA